MFYHCLMFSILVFLDPVLNPKGTINVVEGTSGSISCRTGPTNGDDIVARWTFGSTTLATSNYDVIYSYTNIMRSQSGVYNCTLEQPIGSGSAPRYNVTRSAVVTINVQCELVKYPSHKIDEISSCNKHLLVTARKCVSKGACMYKH